MTVKIAERVFNGSDEEGRKLIRQAASYVKLGVYAIEHSEGNFELVNWPLSKTQIKRLKREFKRKGVKIHANGV